MVQKETFNSTVKNHNFDLLVIFQSGHDFLHFQNCFRTEDIERWIVEGDTPVCCRAACKMDMSVLCCCCILAFHLPLSLLVRRHHSWASLSQSSVWRSHVRELW